MGGAWRRRGRDRGVDADLQPASAGVAHSPVAGDFGIDVPVPHDEAATALDVLQIKKFATNLDASQKRQIEDSFQRVLLGLVRRDVPLAD